VQFRGRYDARLWLLGIARRKVIDSRRRSWRRRETLESENSEDRKFTELAGAMQPSTGPEATLLRTEAIQQIRALVDSLKEEQREALLLQHLEALTIAEIAVVMGRSPAAINSLLQRARTALHRRGQAYFSDLEGSNARTK
jgi:RNA polymerase sigma-70 factor (ECF subfamily)